MWALKDKVARNGWFAWIAFSTAIPHPETKALIAHHLGVVRAHFSARLDHCTSEVSQRKSGFYGDNHGENEVLAQLVHLDHFWRTIHEPAENNNLHPNPRYPVSRSIRCVGKAYAPGN